MKNALPILTIILFSAMSYAQQPENYHKQWEEVTALEKEGLPRSALEVVDDIFKKATREETTSQIVKCLLYRSKYIMPLEEEAQLKVIDQFKEQIQEQQFPTRHILQNILANSLWQYVQQNRWRIYNRTNTEEKVDPDDFRTWDIDTFFTEIDHHFQESLANQLQLQLEDLKKYEDILSVQKNSKKYRPTLFDLLAHNALQFYKTDESTLTQPAYKFEIDNASYLSSAKQFITKTFRSKDTISLQLKALHSYQDLLRFHLKDNNPTALVDANIQRLQYVRSKATKNVDPYAVINTLKAEANSLTNKEIAALYDVERAKILDEFANQFNPDKGERHRWERKEAAVLCERIIERSPNSLAAEKAKVLLNQIHQSQLSITSERFLPIDKPARLLVQYRNHKALYVSVYHINRKQLERFHKLHQQKEKEAFIKDLKKQTEFERTLRDESDFQSHTTEIVFPALPNGQYLVVAKTKDKDHLSHTVVQVTNLGLSEKEDDGSKIFQLIDRNNGRPSKDANITLEYRKDYNRNGLRTENYTTDGKGEFKLNGNNRYRNIVVTAKTESDQATFGSYYHYHYDNDIIDEKTTAKAFLFTDRSIYRPGQTVHFKGILVKQQNGRSNVLVDENVSVKLTNVHGEEVSTLTLSTNEYGSFSGEFILPQNTLTGNFNITAEKGSNIAAYNLQWSSVSFSVEEYKRPKFETKFEPITETYKVNDEITVKGTAQAYAGSNITDAKVVYRVKRNVQYPRWFYWYRPYFHSEPQEITQGETTTDADGNYKISFKAQPDASVDKESLPVFTYEVIADVTDINGETRSTTTFVKVGYHSLLASMMLPERSNKDEKDHKIKITTENLNGEFAPASGSIAIYKLRSPEEVLRPSPWQRPDYQDIPEGEFKRSFPHDVYKSMEEEKGERVFQASFDTEKSRELALGTIKKWGSGKYIVELTSKDTFGQEVKDKVYTVLYSDKDKKVADKQLFAITTSQENYQVGDKATITLGSAAKDLWVTVDVRKGNRTLKSDVLHLQDEKKTIEVPITKEDIGGFSVNYSYAAYNHYQSGKVDINVPYPSSELKIETITFRDKLKPGAEETWTFKVKGPKGGKVTAELLASMYDASLDQFRGHSWNFGPLYKPNYYSYQARNANQSYGTQNFQQRYYGKRSYDNYPRQQYDQLNWFGFHFGSGRILARGRRAMAEMDMEAAPVAMMSKAEGVEVKTNAALEEVVITGAGNAPQPEEEQQEQKPETSFDEVPIRKNLQETAFFFPQLHTDKAGNVSFSFTTPEALTRWKLQLLAHTKTLESTTTTLEAVTQKELMVIPNPPRFFRESDTIVLSSKIANLSEKALSGEVVLQLFDAVTGKEVTSKLHITSSLSGEMSQSEKGGRDGRSAQPFQIDPKGNTNLSWELKIPKGVQAIQYKVIAKAADFSDGERNTLPVLSNRMLVTETLPMWVKNDEIRTFSLDKLKNNSSETLSNHKLTLEMTSNPAWYAVQALPYLMEYPHECAEQVFSRYYANALANHIARSNPRIQEVFDQWKNSEALISDLEKNQELKALLIQETPWLRDAQSEGQQKKRIALLFDLNKMKHELDGSRRKLQQAQLDNGAWSWFKGGRPNRWITQHIVTNYGHLAKLGIMTDPEMDAMMQHAMKYLDDQFIKEYQDMKKYTKDLTKDHLSYMQLHYLYMRSFYLENAPSRKVKEIMAYYQDQAQQYWSTRSLYAKGLIALSLYRSDDTSPTPQKIIKSLKENSITNEELGMHWKENAASWYWYQAPIETQALMTETFAEIDKDIEIIDNLKIWLLKNKQTNQWKTTKATTEAIYALLLQGSDWLSVAESVNVTIGNQKVDPSALKDVKVEAGTGYFKTSWNTNEIKPNMAEVTLTKKGEGIAWGGLYWQYFEDLDKITFAETPLSLKQQLFLKKNTDRGEQLTAIDQNTQLTVGDLIRVRIELRSDRTMEFVHMKDMRASGLEPVDVLSTYKWQDGLGYYQSTKDAATNFFFDHLPKGVYVFEYDLRLNNAGNFSNGITTIQSMYAPEFTSHSEGIRIEVKE